MTKKNIKNIKKIDYSIKKNMILFLKEIIKKTVKRTLKDITVLGGTPFYILIIIFLYYTQKKIIAIKLLYLLILTFIIVSIIRLLYFKERPKKKKYNNIIEKIDASSFPSMHATRSIILALTLNSIYKTNSIITIILFILTILVGISRIYLKKHYLTDIITGWILGVLLFMLI